MSAESPSPSRNYPYTYLPLRDKNISLSPHGFLEYMERSITPTMLLSNRIAQAELDTILKQRFYRGPKIQQLQPEGINKPIKFDQEMDLGKIHNPIRTIELQFSGEDGEYLSSIFIDDAFKLRESDKKHYYFFMQGLPEKDKPPYLRPSDIVSSGIHKRVLTLKARERIKTDLDINDATINWLQYNCDPTLDEYQSSVYTPFNVPLERVPVLGGPAEHFNSVENAWEPSGGIYVPGLRERAVIFVKGALRTVMETALYREQEAESF